MNSRGVSSTTAQDLCAAVYGSQESEPPRSAPVVDPQSPRKEISKLNDRISGELGALRQVVDSQWAAQMNLREELVNAVLYERESRAAEVHELRQTLEAFANHVANVLPQMLAAVEIITRLESVITGGVDTPKSARRSTTRSSFQSESDVKEEREAEQGQEAHEEAVCSPRQFRDEVCDHPQSSGTRHEFPGVRAASSDTYVGHVEKQLDILSADLGPRVHAIEEWMSSGGLRDEHAVHETEADSPVRLDQ